MRAHLAAIGCNGQEISRAHLAAIGCNGLIEIKGKKNQKGKTFKVAGKLSTQAQ